MNVRALMLCLVLSGLCALGQGRADAGVSDLGLPFKEQLTGTALERLPTADSMHQVLAQAFLTALWLSEENLGYSELEPARVSLTGDSAQWTQWRLDSLHLTDPLFDGAEAFHVPWAFVSQVGVLNAESARNQVGAGAVDLQVAPGAWRSGGRVDYSVGGVGGPFALGTGIISFIDGPPDPGSRAPTAERARLLGRWRVQAFHATALTADLTLRTAFDVDDQTRRHVSFGGLTPAGEPYDEHGARATAMFELAPSDRRWRAYLLTEYLQRDHLFAERGYSRDETQALTTGGLLAGVVAEHWRVGLTYKRYDTKPTQVDFARELHDADGMGDFPYEPTGTMDAVRLDVGVHGHDVYFNGDERVLGWTPDGHTQVHALTWVGAPAGTLRVTSRPTTTWVGENRLGWARRFALGTLELAVDAFVTLGHLNAAGLSVLLPGAGGKADLVAHVSPAFEPFVAVGYTPLPLTSQLALSLTPGYLGGGQTLANGMLQQDFGGSRTRVDAGLRTPSTFAVATGFRSRFADDWAGSLQLIGKVWDGVPKLTLDGDPTTYGRFSGDHVYYFDGVPTRYLLVNTPATQTPFGGAVQLQISRLDDGVGFFTLAFSSHSFLGAPPPGNGPWANDVGVVDWVGANPNSDKNAFSSLDSDRAFVLRASGGRHLLAGLWGSFLVAFRDGEPLAYRTFETEFGQVASWNARPRGSPLDGSRPLSGWRSSFQCVIDLQLSWEVPLNAAWRGKVKLAVSNVFDLGASVLERQGLGREPAARSPLATQLPRSVSVGVELLQR